jgi:hypothetical protein
MDRFLNVIVAGEISAKTKEALIKQLSEETPLVVHVTSPDTARPNEMMTGEQMEVPLQRQQAVRRDANITDPVTKMVGLILGSPEFQRQ